MRKEILTWKYIFKKIFNIFLVSFFWCLVIWVVGLNFNDNLLKKFLGSFLQRGYFYQFWFFGSLMIIYLLLPWLQKLKSKIWFFLLLTLLSEIVMIGSLILGRAITSEVTQTFRLWTWLNYFTLGGFIDSIESYHFIAKNRNKIITVSVIMLLILPIYIYVLSSFVNNYYAEYYYDSAYVKLLTILLVIKFKNISFTQKWISFIQSLSTVNMGIFIIHTYVIKMIANIEWLTNPYLNILGIVIVYILSGIVISCLRQFKFGQKILEI